MISVQVGHRSMGHTSGEEQKSIINDIGFPNASFRMTVFPTLYEMDGAILFCTMSSSFIFVSIDTMVLP